MKNVVRIFAMVSILAGSLLFTGCGPDEEEIDKAAQKAAKQIEKSMDKAVEKAAKDLQ